MKLLLLLTLFNGKFLFYPVQLHLFLYIFCALHAIWLCDPFAILFSLQLAALASWFGFVTPLLRYSLSGLWPWQAGSGCDPFAKNMALVSCCLGRLVWVNELFAKVMALTGCCFGRLVVRDSFAKVIALAGCCLGRLVWVHDPFAKVVELASCCLGRLVWVCYPFVKVVALVGYCLDRLVWVCDPFVKVMALVGCCSLTSPF